MDPQARIGLNIVLTDGEELVGSRLGRSLWHLRREQVTRVPKLVTFGSLQGYRVGPGTYQARLTAGDVAQTQSFEVVADPRKNLMPADFQEQQTLLASIIANHGEGTAKEWAQGVVDNFARDPQGGDQGGQRPDHR